MRIKRYIKQHPDIILVDNGSTHNFIDQAMVKRLACQTQSIISIGVFVVNGEKLWTQDYCKKVHQIVQQLEQCTDFFVLPLMGCDVVLEVQWLKELGPIVWDFNKLTMQIVWKDQRVTLHGLVAGAIKLAIKRQVVRLTSSSKGTCTLLMSSIINSDHQ